jgi:ankyrin repeat protein
MTADNNSSGARSSAKRPESRVRETPSVEGNRAESDERVQPHRSHLTLVEVIIGVALLGVAGFFLVSNMRAAYIRIQTQRLVSALDHNEPAVTKALIEKNPQLHTVRGNSGWMPLHWVACFGDEILAKNLIARGAEVNAKGNSGRTPLHDASVCGKKDIAKLLLDCGADVNARSDSGSTPLHHAAASGNKALVELLLDHAADVKVGDIYGWTPLHSATANDYGKLVEFLVAKGADVNARDSRDMTPLRIAVIYKRKGIVELLTASGGKF